ncbi:hypothetical protein CW362_30545 [Streptomyces populi]|uniref:Nudix hydrolase domain-containing protein n=1 Tax=Streptomyces populi TaxID=2058924 RepID=A0A2I0SH54_9ACTN|nr:hypothetical protein [Streptomyces populi]PKT69264.1 hypothetical protein CW362_30545 [Streptomyces populi]
MNTHDEADFLPPVLLSTPFTHVPAGDRTGSRSTKAVIDGAVDLCDSLLTCDLGRPPTVIVRQGGRVRWAAETLTARRHAEWRGRDAGEWSGPKVAVHRLRTGGPGQAEIEVARTDWGQVQAVQAGFLALHGDAHGRASFLSALLDGAGAPVPNIVAVHGVIETEDGMILLNRRSHLVKYHPLTWSCSFEEGMEPADVDEAGSHTFERAAARGIAEEFGLDVGTDDLTVLGLLGDTGAMSVAAVVHCRIPVPAERLYAQATAGQAADAWEHVGCALLPLSPEALAGALLGSARPEDDVSLKPSDTEQGHEPVSWHPTSRYRLLLTMLFRFGRARTAAVLARAAVLRQRIP